MASQDLSDISTEDLYKAAAVVEGYVSVPVSIDQFIEDPYYLGQIYGDGGVYPYWVERLRQIYPNPLYSPGQEILISGAIGIGKECSPDTLVICKRGKVRACEVTRDDELLGTDGKFHKILGIFPQEPHRFWTFQFNDGSTTTTGEDHIWTVSKFGPRSPRHKWVNTTTRDIVEGRMTGRALNGPGRRGKLYIPMLRAPVDYGDDTACDLPVPPYLLGQLLADGSLHGNFSIALSEDDVCAKVRSIVESLGGELHHVDRVSYNIVHCTWLRDWVSSVGLACRAESKFVPDIYLKASPEDRLALLQGYFDGDGYIPGGSKGSGGYEASTASPRLAEGLVDLICSLGGRATVNKKPMRYKTAEGYRICQDSYRIYFVLPADIKPFTSEKHTKRWRPSQNVPYKTIMSWEDAGIQQGVCFMVDSDDHLFAVDRYTFTHNTTLSIIGVLYDLYHIILLKDPHRKYKLIPTTPIVISLITATMDLAGAVMANQLLDAIGASPFFLEHLLPRKGEKIDEDMFPHHIGITFGSRGSHNLGKAVIGAIIDEANFQDKVADQALQNYNTIKRRMQSRFMTKGGLLPCRLWIASSRHESASFLENHIDQKRGRPGIMVFEPSIWEVQAHKGIYCGKTFPVFTGSPMEQPRILTRDEEVEAYAGYVIHVPIEYREQFEDDLPHALQDLAGVATRNGVNLIYNVEKLKAALCLENCMSTDEPYLTLTGSDSLMDFYKTPLPPGAYYAHMDAAKNGDRFGFAMSRVVEQICITKRSAIDGTERSMLSPLIETPLAFGIKALPGSQIPFFKLREFLCDLRSTGVTIAYVSCDGYNTVDMLQLLTKLGFKNGCESVDRTKDAYLKLAENVVLGLHKMPKSRVLENELLNLQNLPNKVDHPRTILVNGVAVKGGKDIADACSASAFCAIRESLTLSQASMIHQAQQAPKSMTMRERQEYVLEYLKLGQ